MTLHKQQAAETNPYTLSQIKTQITATDRLVYDLYELTPEEITLVESNR